MSLKKFTLLVVAFFALLISFGCSEKGSIKIESTLTLEVGKSSTLSVTVEKLDQSKIVWTSNNPDCATVDESGKVTAIAVGEAEIKAEIGAFFAICEVTVIPDSDVDPSLVAEAKDTKLLDVPTLSDLIEIRYTKESWLALKNAIEADIAAINACESVSQVEAYVITAQMSVLVTIDPRVLLADYIDGWVESNAEYAWTGELTYAKFQQALSLFNSNVSEETSEEDAFEAFLAFIDTQNMDLRKAKENAKDELRLAFEACSEYAEMSGIYWTYVVTAYGDGLKNIEAATSNKDSGTAAVVTRKESAISGVNTSMLNGIKTLLVNSINTHISELDENEYFPEKWQKLLNDAESDKENVRNATSVELAIEARDAIIVMIDGVPKIMETIVSIVELAQETGTGSELVYDVYSALLYLARNEEVRTLLNEAIEDSDKILAEYLSLNLNKAAELRIVNLIHNVYSSRIVSISSAFTAALNSAKTLLSANSQSELTALINEIKEDISDFDKDGDFLAFIRGFEERLVVYEQQMWEIDWKDDYFLSLTLDLDGGQIDGLTSEDLEFSLRLRYFNDALMWRFDNERDMELKRLIELSKPQKEGHSFINWMMQNEWYLFTVTQGETIVSADWLKWDHESWATSEVGARDYLTVIDFSKLAGGRFISKINSELHVYPSLQVTVVANWRNDAGEGDEADAFIGTWSVTGGLAYNMEIRADGTATEEFSYNGGTPSITNYTWTMNGSVMVLSSEGRADMFFRIKDGKMECAATIDFTSINRTYTAV